MINAIPFFSSAPQIIRGRDGIKGRDANSGSEIPGVLEAWSGDDGMGCDMIQELLFLLGSIVYHRI